MVEAKHFARSPPITAFPNETVRDAAVKMARHNIGLLVLVDEADPARAVGVVSERDIVRAIADRGSLDVPIWEIATRSVVAVDVSDPLWKAAKLMVSKRIRHVVVTEGGKLYGVISIRDLISEDSALRSLSEHYEYVLESGMAATE